MEKEIPSLGFYQWTRSNDESNPRPSAGSSAAEEAQIEYLKNRDANLTTPEGQAWLRRHGVENV
jgi:hypothetical protein